MVENGHRWKDLQDYKLSEIGVFLRATVKAKQERQISELRLNWYANHLNQKGLTSVVAEMTRNLQVADATVGKKGDLDPVFIKKQWSGLALALGKLNRGKM